MRLQMNHFMKKSARSMANYLDVLNEEQRAAVVHEGSPLLILAGAGSGKTRVITTKIAYLISKGIEPWSILAVTFTKKAANEMKERAVALEQRAEDAQIRTFHSFGSWFLRKYAEAAGISPSFTVPHSGQTTLCCLKNSSISVSKGSKGCCSSDCSC